MHLARAGISLVHKVLEPLLLASPALRNLLKVDEFMVRIRD